MGYPASTADRLAGKASITELFAAAEAGNGAARSGLFAVLYEELHRMAQRELRRNPANLSPTTLLHETYLNVSQRQSTVFADRGQFMAYASRAMRGLVIDYLRNRGAKKRGAAFEITSLPTELPLGAQMDFSIEELNDALEALSQIDAQLAECVDLRFFCGLSFQDIAKMRNVSERTVQRDWVKARVLLSRFIQDTPSTTQR